MARKPPLLACPNPRRDVLKLLLASATASLGGTAVLAEESGHLTIGLSLPLTGSGASFGQQARAALEIWVERVNAEGGLAGRNVVLEMRDDATDPERCAEIYEDLIARDKVDLLLGPYMTPLVESALPVIAAHGRTTVSFLATGANDHLHYDGYFSMIGGGRDPARAISRGFFAYATGKVAQPARLALLTVDAGLGRAARLGALANARAVGATVVYDAAYHADIADLSGMVGQLADSRPNLVFVAGLPRETAMMVRALGKADLTSAIVGGLLVGLNDTRTKVSLGPALNGFVSNEGFLPTSAAASSEEARALLDRYAAIAKVRGLDPLGHGVVPFAYAAGQTLAQAVRATGSINHAELARWLHSNTIETVLGEIAFGPDGEWQDSGFNFVRYENVLPKDLDQFRNGRAAKLVWPILETDAVMPPGSAAEPHNHHGASPCKTTIET